MIVLLEGRNLDRADLFISMMILGPAAVAGTEILRLCSLAHCKRIIRGV